MSTKYTRGEYERNIAGSVTEFYNQGLVDIPEKEGESKKKGYRSMFNRYSIVFIAPNMSDGTINEPLSPFDEDIYSAASVPEHEMLNPTAATIIKNSYGRNAVEYEWPDFLYCHYYGIIPNNYMLTLRRFGTPVEDNILNPNVTTGPDIGRLITWIDGENNKLEELLGWTHKMTWKEMESEIQTLQSSGYGGNLGTDSMFGKIMGYSDNTGNFANQSLRGDAAMNFNPYESYKNRVYGPLDVVAKMMTRDRGLDFDQDIKLVFLYDLKSIDGINPKTAMLDLISNVLLVTYNRGEFWGGATRFYGGGPKIKPLGDVSKLASGDFAGYLSSMVSDIGGRFMDMTGGAGLSLEGIGNAIKSIGGNIMSELIGGQLDKMGRPEVQAINALLSGEATGEWHLTIGNPLSPIAMMGNLILDSTVFGLVGPLGRDDFPSQLKVECTLKRARPRDIDDIANMFNSTAGRTYFSDLPEKKYYMNYPLSDNKKYKRNSNTTPSARLSNNLIDAVADTGNNILKRFPNHSDAGVSEKIPWTN